MRISKVHILNLECCIIAIGLAMNARILMEPRNRAALSYIWRQLSAWVESAWR